MQIHCYSLSVCLCVCISLSLSLCVCVCVSQFKLALAHDGSGQGAALVAATATQQQQRVTVSDDDIDDMLSVQTLDQSLQSTVMIASRVSSSPLLSHVTRLSSSSSSSSSSCKFTTAPGTLSCLTFTLNHHCQCYVCCVLLFYYTQTETFSL